MSAPAPSLEVLDGLDPLERVIVELTAVFHLSVTRTDLARALGLIGHRVKGRVPSSSTLPPVLASLVARGLLHGEVRYEVRPELSHAIMVDLAQRGALEQMVNAVRTVRPATLSQLDLLTCVRELRCELYAGRWEAAREWDERGPGAMADVIEAFDPVWVASLPDDLRASLLINRIAVATSRLEACDEEVARLAELSELSDSGHHLLVERRILEGQLDEAEALLAARTSVQSQVGRAWLLVLRGRYGEATGAYEQALTAYLKFAGKRARYFPDRAGLFFVVALLATGETSARTRALAICGAAGRPEVNGSHRAYTSLRDVVEVFENLRSVDDTFLGYVHRERKPGFIEDLVAGLAVVWAGAKPDREFVRALEARESEARKAGLIWLAGQYACVLEKLGSRSSERAGLIGANLAEAVREPERWAEQLDALLAIVTKVRAPKSAPVERDVRLVWILTEQHGRVGVTPREQFRSKGKWSKGRKVALGRLFSEWASMEHLTPADRLACREIEEEVYFDRGYRNVLYHLDPARAVRALSGEPNLLSEDLSPVEVREREVTLRVEPSDGDSLAVTLDPTPHSGPEGARVTCVGPTTFELVRFEPEHHAITAVLGPKGLEVPRAAEGRLREVLAALSSVAPIQADLGAAPGEEDCGESVPPDATPRVLVRARGEGLSVEIVVRPLGPSGPSAPSGEGGASFFGSADGRRLHATRDLAEEARLRDALVAQCPTLASAEPSRLGYVLNDREGALETLLELRRVTAIEWPDGEAYQVSDPVDIKALSVKLRGASSRFEIEGSLATPGGDPLALDTLLGYLAASPSRFLRIEGSEAFVALTDALRDRLDELGALTVPGKPLRFHPLFVGRVDALLEEARVRADAAWKRQRARLASAGEDPDVPATFRGELRPYQLDGFRWLARLGRMGAGACLADEMGLGKTVQALALLVQRAPEGPSLVVAPTSVLPSHRDEIARFAPTLRPRLYAGARRDGSLKGLGPFDVVLTSYTFLQQDIEALAKIRFAVAVLDEAQAIKNAGTLRAAAAFRLQAEQRIATTGTPVENRLDELFSLFRFLNPGLLGTAADFSREPPARVKQLVTPFILRRTKTAVVAELPPKTEVTLRVDPLLEEAALYEVLRTEALESIAEVRKGTKRRMHILAALTKLRRAASNARLVLTSEKDASSSKLEALGDLLDDLLPNRHRVLIFSQFVDHLALVREMLDAREVTYEYLDGATPMKARKAAVDAFQAGRAEAFLISLKAGGVGLNLTAADYVVHMDPWWNPAVEDQASDRAHRIGQTRPVTVYRIVARGTIEEGILELHHRKRELAADLLAGTESAARLSEEELVELIRGA